MTNKEIIKRLEEKIRKFDENERIFAEIRDQEERERRHKDCINYYRKLGKTPPDFGIADYHL